MTRFHVGTSGWQYDHWRGAFYPDDRPKRDWLSYYIQHFSTVELNNSFYRLPSSSSWRAWREVAPDGFRFAVKASRFITHIKRFKDPSQSLTRLFRGADQLQEHLGPVLYQAPPDFHRTPENVERLDHFLEELPASCKHVLEFRHESWFEDETLAQLRSKHAGFCSFDAPDLECPLVATANFAYVRFHGSSAKYASNYSERELFTWATKLKKLARDVDEVWVYFNNDARGYAVANARSLGELL